MKVRAQIGKVLNLDKCIGRHTCSVTCKNVWTTREGVEYACPFRTKDGLAGIVLLGKRIAGRGMKQEDFEFLRILLNVAQGAYDNALMFEREHERTLGIVKTLMSIIEDNTLLKGTSEIVSRYVGMTAKSMDYPEEHFKDLIYGTVLRDMGMVKVSDLILRSPRDLSKEEWEIIKRHPEDGGELTPGSVRIPLHQHTGAPAAARVRPGDRVQVGDLIGEIPEGALGARVHASLTGTVTDVGSAVSIKGT